MFIILCMILMLACLYIIYGIFYWRCTISHLSGMFWKNEKEYKYLLGVYESFLWTQCLINTPLGDSFICIYCLHWVIEWFYLIPWMLCYLWSNAKSLIAQFHVRFDEIIHQMSSYQPMWQIYFMFAWPMMTSSNGDIFRVTGLLCGDSPIPGEFPSQRPVTRSFDLLHVCLAHDDVIKWRHFPRYWPFVRGFTDPRWIPLTKASDAELWCFFDLRLE